MRLQLSPISVLFSYILYILGAGKTNKQIIVDQTGAPIWTFEIHPGTRAGYLGG